MKNAKNMVLGIVAIVMAITLATVIFTRTSRDSETLTDKSSVLFNEPVTGVLDLQNKPAYVTGRFGKFLILQENGTEVTVTPLKTQMHVIQAYGITPDGKIIVYETDELNYRTVAENLVTGRVSTIGEKFGADATYVSPIKNEAVSQIIVDDGGITRNGLLYVNLDTGEENLLVDRDVAGGVTWSADGGKIFFNRENVVKRSAFNLVKDENPAEVETSFLTPASVSIADGIISRVNYGHKNLPPTLPRMKHVYSAEEIRSLPLEPSEEGGANAYARTGGETVYSPDYKVTITHNGEQQLDNVRVSNIESGFSNDLTNANGGQLLLVLNNGLIIWKSAEDFTSIEFVDWSNHPTLLAENATTSVGHGLPIKDLIVTQVGSGYSSSCGVVNHTGNLAYAIDQQGWPNSGPNRAHIMASAKGTVVEVKKAIVTCSTVSGCNLSYDPYRQNCSGGAWGNYIIIRHDDGKRTLYAHLTSNTATINLNDQVCQGQYIADQGHTGTMITSNLSTCGNHLHHQMMAESDRPSVISSSIPFGYDGINSIRCQAYNSPLTEVTSCNPPGSYSLTATPVTVRINRGSTTSFNIQTSTNNGFRGTVNFFAINLPGAVLSGTGFSPSSVNIQANGTRYDSTLTIRTNGNTPRGTFDMTLEGRSGNKISRAYVQLIVS